MKKYIALFLALLMIPVAFAQQIGAAPETAQTVEAAAGLTPDSPLYFIDEIGDSIKVSMAASKVDKVRARLEIAEEKLAEYQLMQEKGKTTAAAKALQKQDEEVAEAGKEQLTADEKAQVQENYYKHIQVLERVREKIRARNPDQAKGLDNAIDNSSKKLEDIRAELPEEDVETDDDLETETKADLDNSWAGEIETDVRTSPLPPECEKYHFSTCPKGCIERCISSSSSCGGKVACLTDCEGPGSCVSLDVSSDVSSDEDRWSNTPETWTERGGQ